MNRVVNVFTLLILGVFCFMIMVVVYDLSISNLHLKGMPYKREIFTGLALLVFLLGLIRMQRRWQGMRDMKKYRSFKFTVPVARKHRMLGFIITLIEAVFFTAVIWFCTLFIPLEPTYVYPMILVLGVLILESLIFAARQYKGGNAFVVGFDDTVMGYFDREIHLFYYTGLQRAQLYQKDLISLEYREELNMGFETTVIEESDRKAFRDAFVETLESKNIYVDDSLRNWE
ncbi:MAG: hypothetical protein HYZ14_16790 [Bacteroidetes bacterium]|nr:hypothetical protein [Bacteroidota bacterium]